MDNNPQVIDVTFRDGGYITYLKPWRLPDDGFQICMNAYIFRDSLIKRSGYQTLAQVGALVTAESVGAMGFATYTYTYMNMPIVPYSVSVTDGTQTLNDNGNGAFWQPAFGISNISQAVNGIVTTTAPNGYSMGQVVNFFGVIGMEGVNSMPDFSYNPFTITSIIDSTHFTIGNTAAFDPYVSGGSVRLNAGSINYTNGVAVIVFPSVTTGAVTTTYDYALGLPIMGLTPFYINGTNLQQLVAFDTQRAYLYSTSMQSFTDISGSVTWTGSNSDFFWSMNYYQSLWTTNGFDPIRYYYTGGTWQNFTPLVNSTETLDKAILMLSFKQRMIAFGPTIAGVFYPNRAIWCQNGTPYVTNSNPFGVSDANSWRNDIDGKGGFTDAATQEEIVTADFQRDVIIVKFEQSDWRLRYTGNELLPFAWERINSTYGCQSQFSVVPFDEGVVTVSPVGIVQTDYNSAERIDQKIVDFAYNMSAANNGVLRIQGIRDFENQLVYWTYNSNDNNVFPDNLLVYNYENETWSVWDIPLTALGQYTSFFDITWRQMTQPWSNYNQRWSQLTGLYGVPIIVGGTSDGHVVQLNALDTDDGMPITPDIVTKAYNPYRSIGHQGKLVYVDFYVDSTTNDSGVGLATINFYGDEAMEQLLVTKVLDATNLSANGTFYRIYANITQDLITMEITQSMAQSAIGDPFVIRYWQLHFEQGGRML